jgi:hypothetical protein
MEFRMTEMVAKLDDLGKPAWIALMVLSFILFWPVGLAVLAFLIWSGRMGCGHRDGAAARFADMPRWGRCRDTARQAWAQGGGGGADAFRPSGNRAFDEYRSETLKRLEDEAHEFRAFLERLRHAKDKAEFDQFMTDRKSRPDDGPAPQGT